MRYSALGAHEFSEQRVVPDMVVVEYSYADFTGGSADLDLPLYAFGEGDIVLAVAHEVVEDLSSMSTLTVGESGGSANGYLDTSDITLGTVGNFANSLVAGQVYAQGRVHAAVDWLELTVGAVPTAGVGRVYIWMIHASDLAATWRLPAQG
jgi:hypothetical protein